MSEWWQDSRNVQDLCWWLIDIGYFARQEDQANFWIEPWHYGELWYELVAERRGDPLIPGWKAA